MKHTCGSQDLWGQPIGDGDLKEGRRPQIERRAALKRGEGDLKERGERFHREGRAVVIYLF